MPSLILSLINLITNGTSSLLLQVQNFLAGGITGGMIGAGFSNLGREINNTITMLFWSIEKFLLGWMEAFEYAICSFLGIGTTVDDYLSFAVKTDIMDTFVRTFKALVAVSIVLMIVFTIFAIVRQEWQNATNKKGLSPDQNQKGPIVMKLFRGIMSIIVLPIAMIIIIGAVNSTLTAFNRAMKGDYDYTVASSVLSTSSYDANKFRVYAEDNYRVPIVVQAYNVDDYKVDEKDKLVSQIKSLSVQTKLQNTRSRLGDPTTNLSFRDSLVYSNNQLINSSKYADYYESFICTPEQYQVLAQFIDYAQLTQSNFYIRPVDDEYVEWKYVDEAVFDTNTKSLTINYRDYSDLNGNNSTADTYSITYSPSMDITSPISNALDSLKALLGVDQYSNIVYNEMERDEDYINKVQWANEKVSIHFSKNFDINDSRTWTSTDQIIMYEFFHFSSNNDFSKYNINDFYYIEAVSNKNPVTFDAYKYVYREYYEEAGAYSPEKTITLVIINGNYYLTELSNEEMDAYGDYYYLLKEFEGAKFLDSSYVTIYENKKETLTSYSSTKACNAIIKLSSGFNINNPSGWSYTDQIIMYEYYKDLSYANKWSTYSISDFYTGIEIPTYTISSHPFNVETNTVNISGQPKTYVLINGVYYEVQLNDALNCYELMQPSGSTKFLDFINSGATSNTFYNYQIEINDASKYGISTSEANFTADDFILINKSGSQHYDTYFNNSNNVYSYYGNPHDNGNGEIVEEISRTNSIATAFKIDNDEVYNDVFDIRFSGTFDYTNTETWSYYDYFVFYLYSKYLAYSGNFILDQLNSPRSVLGEFGRVGVEVSGNKITKYEYFYKISDTILPKDVEIYLKIDDILNISKKNILQDINLDLTLDKNNFDKTEKEDNKLMINTSGMSGNVSINSAQTETREFKFSNNFTISDVSTWTVQDYILLVLNENKVIDIVSGLENAGNNDIYTVSKETLARYSYSSLVFVQKNAGADSTNKYYLFGTTKSNDNIFINEKYISSVYNLSLDDWLKTKLVDFVTKLKGSNNIVSGSSEIVKKLYTNNNLKQYEYTLGELVKKFVEENCLNINNPMFEVYQNIETLNYNNPNFAFDNLSTWTRLDFAIYYVTGKISSTTYSLNLITKDSTNYIVIGNYAFNLSGLCGNTYSINVSNRLTSNSIRIFDNDDAVISYFNSTLFNDTDIVLKDYKEVIYDSNAVYTYLLKNDTANSVTNYTYLDAYILGVNNKYSLSNNSSDVNFEYEFTAFRIKGDTGNDVYLKLGEKDKKLILLRVEEGSVNSQIFRDKEKQSSIVIDNSVPLFTQNAGTFTSFEGIDSNNYKLMDAIIYNETNSMNKAEYAIYQMNGREDRFICLGDKFIRYDASISKNVDSKKDVKSSTFASLDTDKAIDYLYDEFYSSSIKQNIGNVEAKSESVKFTVEFNLENINTWEPLSIILYKKGIVSKKLFSNKKFKGEFEVEVYTDSRNSNKKYFLFEGETDDDVSYRFYLDISNYLTITENLKGTEKELNIERISSAKQELLLNLMLNYDGKKNENINSFNDFKNLINNNLEIEKNYVNLSTASANSFYNIKISNTQRMNLNDITTWTWYDLFYYYLFQEVNQDVTYYNYVSYSGLVSSNSYIHENYVRIKNSSNNLYYYIKYNPSDWNNLTTNTFKEGENVNVNFNLGSNTTKIGIIYNVLTGINQGTITEYTSYEDLVKFYQCGESFIIIDDITETIQGGVVTGNDGKTLFRYNSSATRTNISSWNTLDLYIKYVKDNTNNTPETISGTIYDLGGEYFFAIQDSELNINVSVLGLRDSSFDKEGRYISATNETVNSLMSFPKSNDAKADSLSGIKSFVRFDINAIGNLLSQSIVKGLENNEVLKLYFSPNFDFSNYSSWKLSDFLLYYIYEKSLSDEFKNFGCKESGHSSTCEAATRNFQYYVNLGYVPAYLKNLSFTSSSGETNRLCLVIGPENDKINSNDIDKYCYVNYDLFNSLYAKTLSFVDVNFDGGQKVKLEIIGKSKDTSDEQAVNNFGVKFETVKTASDFVYNNYYYYKNTSSIFDSFPELRFTGDLSGSKKAKQLNLKLSTGFKLEDVSTWNILDYIIVYEYSRNVNGNLFYGLTFDDLKNSDFYIKLNHKGDDYVLVINGNYYNLAKWVDSNEVVNISNSISNVVEIVTANSLGSRGYDFKMMSESFRYNLNISRNKIIKELSVTADSFSYSSVVRTKSNGILSHDDKSPDSECERINVELTYYMNLHKEMYRSFQFSIDKYPVYTISPIVKTVSWPQKLMNDMMVTYPDLNWANLIATDGWIDTLGEYHSGTISGQFLASGNSSNITAVGMVLSEFFLSVAKEQKSGSANYSYESIFDESTINALMLAMLGEEDYNALVMEAKVFVDLFNVGFASILDDIANERGIEILDGQVNNLVMSVYKSYLATAILSSDVGEYLYTIATRVYAQYTIYESLARASNNYAGYYAYMNGQTDENGEVIGSFTYSSFYDLVKYENQYYELEDDYGNTKKVIYLREGDVPTFTFNYKSVYRFLLEKGYIKSKLMDKDSNITNEDLFEEEIIKSLSTFDDESLIDWITSLINDISSGIGSGFNEVFKAIKEVFQCNSLLDLLNTRKNRDEQFFNEAPQKLSEILGVGKNYFDRLVTIFNQPENTFSDVLNALIKYYNDFYLSGTNLTNKIGIESTKPEYCFMLDVYYLIKQEVRIQEAKDPVYIQLYMDYIKGNIKRWEMVSDSSIEAGSIYIKDYNKHKSKLLLSSVQFIATYNSCFGVTYSEDPEASEDENSANLKNNFLSDFSFSNLQSYVNILKYTFDYEEYLTKVEKKENIEESEKHENRIAQEAMKKIFFDMSSENLETIANRFININFKLFSKSQNGDAASWKEINDMYDALGVITEELKKVNEISAGDITANGSYKIARFNYDDLYSKMISLYNYLGNYISEQKILDKVQKTCLTFTLAQYGDNFIEEGLKITINSSSYTIKTAVSAQRLAEYVYGGSFLTKFGVPPTYTNEEFDGIISVTTTYDKEDGIGKKKLDGFTKLREFARKIADYTGKLYYLTNMNDISNSVNDSIAMTEYIMVKNPLSAINNFMPDNYIKSTLEYLILDHIVANKYLTYDELEQLIVAENDKSIVIQSGDEDLINWANGSKTVDGKKVNLTEDDNFTALRKYLLYIQTTNNSYIENEFGENITSDVSSSTSGDRYYGYYIARLDNDSSESNSSSIRAGYSGNYSRGNRTASERVEVIFKKVIEYLTGYSSADDKDTDYEGITIDYTNMNFKRFKNVLMNALIDYKQYENATGEQNTKRYLSIFYLISGEFNYYIGKTNYKGYGNQVVDEMIGRTINGVNKNVSVSDIPGQKTLYQECLAICYQSFGEDYYLRAEFKEDETTKGMILKLANIPNRPIEELVNLEYNDLYNKNGYYDEALGDSFVVCLYDEPSGLYYPLLARNRSTSFRGGDKYSQYLKKFDIVFKTDYIDTDHAYPILARGIITADGLPTAIRMINGEIQYYRTDIGATAAVGDELFSEGNVSGEVKTLNYTSYVNSSFPIFGGKSAKVSYINSVNKSYEFKSDAEVFFIQSTSVYELGSADDFYAVSVLDDFQAFFHIPVFGSMTFHILMIVGFISVFPVLFKALLAAMIRILDLMFLILMGPVAISTNSLEVTDKPMRIFEEWKRKLTNSLLSAFGLVASFSLYYILMSTTLQMTFISEGDRTMQIIYTNPALKIVTSVLGSILQTSINASFFNTIIKWCFILVASMMIQSAAELLGELITGGRVTKSFSSQLSDKEPTETVMNTVNSIKSTATKFVDIYTGEALINAMHAAKETAIRSVPGSSIVRSLNEHIKTKRDKHNAKKMAKKAAERGVSMKVAEQLSRDICDTKTKIRREKQKQHAEKANKFLASAGMTDKDSQFFSSNQIQRMTRDDNEKQKAKQAKRSAKMQNKDAKKQKKARKKEAKKQKKAEKEGK